MSADKKDTTPRRNNARQRGRLPYLGCYPLPTVLRTLGALITPPVVVAHIDATVKLTLGGGA